MTQDRFASYTNDRYWIEMLSAGFLHPEWHGAIIDYRTTHGGELLGTTHFSGHLDDWPYAGDGIAVRRATTRWGLVNSAIAPREDGSIQARIELPHKDFPAEVRLRVRTPAAAPIQAVIINGRPHLDFDAQHEYIRIVRPTDQVLETTVRHRVTEE